MRRFGYPGPVSEQFKGLRVRVCQNTECGLFQNRDRTGAINIGTTLEVCLLSANYNTRYTGTHSFGRLARSVRKRPSCPGSLH